MTDYAAEMDRICSAAQARMDAGQPPLRVIGAHFPMAQASAGNLPWMTEDEATRLAALRHLASRNGGADAAAARIAARIVHRKAQKLSMSPVTCTESGGIST